MTRTEAAGTSLRVHRTVAAPRERVYDAFLDRRALERWYHPGVMRTEVHALEAREGGTFRISMTPEDGPAGTYTCTGTFLELRPHERIVHTWAWEEDGAPGPTSRVTVTFEDAPGGTRVTLLHEGLPDRETTDSHAEGWSGALENLCALFPTHKETTP